MKSLIAYYSFTGNTDRVVKIFGKILGAKGAVDIQRLRPKKEVASFLGQCRSARLREKPELDGEIRYDASPYDLVLIASPVWAFAPAPAVNTYLDKISGLRGKRVIVLLTSGSGLGVNNCFKSIRNALKNMGADRVDEINIPDRRQGDGDFIVSSLSKIL